MSGMKSFKAYSIDYILDSKELYDIVLNGIAQNQAKAGTIKIIITHILTLHGILYIQLVLFRLES